MFYINKSICKIKGSEFKRVKLLITWPHVWYPAQERSKELNLGHLEHECEHYDLFKPVYDDGEMVIIISGGGTPILATPIILFYMNGNLINYKSQNNWTKTKVYTTNKKTNLA